MGVLDKLLKTADIWLPDDRQVNYNKGVDFEKYVAGLFNEYYAIKDWTRDNSDKRSGIKVESDKNPDFIVRYKPRDEVFAVECKYRSYVIWNERIKDYVINWAYPAKIQAYNAFSKREGIPVFIVIGLAGSPDKPETMFCIPLEEARYPDLYPSILEKYERPPEKNFFWRNGQLS